MLGPAVRRCLTSGQWSGNPVQCKAFDVKRNIFQQDGENNLGPVHTYPNIFESATFSFRCKNFSVHSQHIQIQFVCPHSSDGIRIHSRAQGSSSIKCVQSMRHKARDSRGTVATNLLCCCCAAILDYCSVRYLERKSCGFKNIRIRVDGTLVDF